jgi:phosphatidylserine/phosphatidylglycerophosphate/cardiolipin synthase-like enzyme
MKDKKSLISLLIAAVFACITGLIIFVSGGNPLSPTQTDATEAAPTPKTETPIDTTGAATDIEFFSFPETDEQVLLDRIANARSRVWMKMYLLTDFRVVDALAKAKQNGADVRAMIEQNPFGGGSSPKQAFDRLKAAGINVKYANPVFRFTHEKSFIIDDSVFILTANMTRSAFTRNREFGVVHTVKADVAECVAAYNADWSRDKFTPQSSALVWSPVNSRTKLTGLVGSAQKTLLVYAELAQDDPIIDAMIQAQKRGVKVRFLISPSKQNDGEDANKVDLDKLQKGGVKVRYISSPYQHSKAFVADDTLAYIGSINLSTGSMEFNRELGILFSDKTAIRLLDEIFEKDWNKATDR